MSGASDSEISGRGTRKRTVVLASILILLLTILVIVSIILANKAADDRPASISPSITALPSASSVSPAPDPSPRPSATLEPIGTSSDAVPGVSVTIGKLTAVDGVAANPGEIAGPAVRVPVILRNTGSMAFPLDSLVVSVDYGDTRTPASELSGPNVSRLAGEIAPGVTVEGAYVFTIPIAERDLIRASVDFGGTSVPLVFSGAVS